MLWFIVIVLAASLQASETEPRSIKGLYRNPALGYSVVVPEDLEGVAGDQGVDKVADKKRFPPAIDVDDD